MHAGEEGVAPGGAALLGVVVGEERAFLADPVDVGRLADHQAAVVDRRLHVADVVAHDEEDVGLGLLLGRRRRHRCAAATPTASAPRQAAPAHRAKAPPRRCRVIIPTPVAVFESLAPGSGQAAVAQPSSRASARRGPSRTGESPPRVPSAIRR